MVDHTRLTAAATDLIESRPVHQQQHRRTAAVVGDRGRLARNHNSKRGQGVGHQMRVGRCRKEKTLLSRGRREQGLRRRGAEERGAEI